MKSPYDIIRRPIITERTSEMMESKKYVFEVDRRVNKTEIKQAIEAIFKGSKVTAVNTMNMPGKPKRYGKYNGYTSEWKKAVVTLSPESKELAFFETAE
ncbi:50S ribosomal protein L23 [Paenibacillus sp. TRM 82003]|nr:50S ribosomal protein L23 [Paenibacillus sp. TRM 82003]